MRDIMVWLLDRGMFSEHTLLCKRLIHGFENLRKEIIKNG